MNFPTRRFTILAVFATLVGCATYVARTLDARFGPADPARFDRPVTARGGVDYQRDVQPIFDRRCAVCHGCYDAPCQLNLTRYAGVTRGANRRVVYNGARLLADEPSRLGIDAERVADWRNKEFYPVLNERQPLPEANREGSVLYRMLELKRAQGAATEPVLPAQDYDFSLDRKQQCPAIEDMDRFEKKFPHWGMPYGLPPISEREHTTLTRWIEAGAPGSEPAPLSPAFAARIAAWEAFLNGDSLKAQLVNRYIYEHWYIGHLYFDDLPGNEFFELVRSATPPGQPIRLIATRRPYDDPGVPRVYYRLRRLAATPLAKTHMPVALGAARMQRIKSWFYDARYEISALPSYQIEEASNPFVTFAQLPTGARYRFLIDDAHFTMSGFIKGPVCRGQVALNVINDYFWVVFVDPRFEDGPQDAAFLAQARANLRLPAEHDSTTRLLRFQTYSKLEADYLGFKSRYLNQRLAGRNLTLKLLWNGDGGNPNAALTVFRHFDSATVVPGLIGEQPQTVLVLGYTLFERIHYLLVAGFDVYGNVGHQLATRLYMDFLRMEGELNFLGFLPRADRQAVHDHWYRDADASHIEYFNDVSKLFAHETGIKFRSREPLTELYAMLKRYFAPLADRRLDPAASGLSANAVRQLVGLNTVRGRAASIVPETALLTVRAADGRQYHFTVLRHSAHSNVAELLGEEKRRLPDEDQLMVLNGFVGAYPNAFWSVHETELPQFVSAVETLSSEGDYRALLDHYGIRRTDPRFWAHSDLLHQAYRDVAPREAGTLDYNRLENR